MDRENQKLHILFFPGPAHGHMIPMAYMATLFAKRGVRTTIVTTPLNLPIFSKILGESKTHVKNNVVLSDELVLNFNIITIKFPCVEAGLPEGCENLDSIPSPSFIPNFVKATQMLQESLEPLLLQHHPHCLIADMFFTRTNDLAAKFNIPRIVFHGMGCFAACAEECVRLYKPHKNVLSDSEPFVIPNLPGEIKMTRMLLSEPIRRDDSEWMKQMGEISEAESGSFGVVMNSFYELEEEYANHYSKVLGRKIWHIGPVSLCNREVREKGKRGKEASIDEQECLKWLDSKQPNSVLYVCFGTVSNFTKSQLKEIAMGLEASEQNFIWVVRKNKKDQEEWILEGFEERIEGKGLIIRGWAPQVLILDHEAVGGFVTHCGWNSMLEAISAGVPMVTWPVDVDQFYNEKFVTEVLGIGVPVGVKKLANLEGDCVKKEAIEKAVRKIMVEEEAVEMSNRVKNFAKMAKQSVEEGGSSYLGLSALIQELESLCH